MKSGLSLKSSTVLWTKLEVEARFIEAAHTLYRLPQGTPHIKLTIWPQIIRDFYERLMEDKRVLKSPPTPQAIDRMDETLRWLAYLDPDERKIVWLRASGVKWRLIAPRFKVTRQTAWRDWVYALEKIVYRLNQQKESQSLLTRC